MAVTIATAKIATEVSAPLMDTQTPFSNRQRGLVIDRLDGRFSYCFDYARPAGVYLVGNGVRQKLENDSALPFVDGKRNVGFEPSHGAKTAENKASTKQRLDFWVHLVNGCNLACHYCYIPHLQQSVSDADIQRQSMSRETVEPLLAKLFTYCSREGIEEIGFKFAGGEPTLNQSLLEHFCATALRLKGDLKVRFGIITNGTFDPSAIALFARFKVNVSISIDGSEKAHDQIRFTKGDSGARVGTFGLIFRNVDEMVRSGLRPYFLFTVTPKNVDTVAEFSALARDYRLGYRLSLVRLPIRFSNSQLERVGNTLVAFYSDLAETQPIDLPIERYARFAEWNLQAKKEMACSTGRSFFALDIRGQVSSCQMRIDRTYGSAIDEDFGDIKTRLGGCSEQRVLTTPSEREGPCRSCEFYHVCAGGCPQHTRMSVGSFHAKSPWCEVYGRVLPVYVKAVARQMMRAYDAKNPRLTPSALVGV